MPENKNDRSRQNQGQQPPQKQDKPVPRPGEDKDRNKVGQRQGEGKNLDDLEDRDIDEGDISDEDRVTQRHPAMGKDTDKDRR
jgi:hypothetical protein